jgi:hypothetical protein
MAADELKEKLDQINAFLGLTEEYFVAQGYVARAEVQLFEDENLFLAWGKLANKYSLIVARMDGGEIVEQHALMRSPMEMRTRAIDLLDQLETALQQELRETEVYVKAQAVKLENWVNKRRGA